MELEGETMTRPSVTYDIVQFNGMKCLKKTKLLTDCLMSEEKILLEVTWMEKARHRNVVHYIGHEIINDTLCIYMEYCPGGALVDFLSHIKTKGLLLQLGTIYKLSIEELEGLSYIHTKIRWGEGANEKGIIHRSICPDNIYLSRNYVAMIGNFSTSRIPAKTMNTRFDLSPYSPNEQQKMNYDQSVDIFALGCVWYEQITLKQLYTIDNIIKKQNVEFSIPPTFYETIDKDFIKLIKEMTSHDPLKRPKLIDIYNNPFISRYMKRRILLFII